MDKVKVVYLKADGTTVERVQKSKRGIVTVEAWRLQAGPIDRVECVIIVPLKD